MGKKYELIESDINGMYRIRALRDFGDVKSGNIGGYVSGEHNLSHDGNCWIYDKGQVFGNGQVYENGRVFGNGQVYGNGKVSGRGEVCNNGHVYDNGRVYGNSRIYDNGRVYGNSQVCGWGRVYGEGRVKGDDIVSQTQYVNFSHCTTDLSKDLISSIRCQTGIIVVGDKVLGYKRVNKDLTSLYDTGFQYKVGEWVVAEEVNNDPLQSCASGLHFSHATFWEGIGGDAVIMVYCNLEDIVAVQEGKIRCKKLFVVGVGRLS